MIARSLAWMGLAQGLSLVLQLSVQIVLARTLSLHDAGVYAVALSMVGALSLFQNLGLQALIVREETLSREVAATTFTIQMLIAIAVAVAVYAASFASEAFLGDPAVGRVLAALSIVPLVTGVSFLPLALLEREGRFKQIAVTGSLGSMSGAIATVGTAVAGASYMSAAYGQIVNTAVVTLALIATARRHFRVSVSFVGWRKVGHFGLSLLAINGINALGLRLSDILMPRFLSLSALGLYSRAGGLNGLIWGNLQTITSRVMLVDFAAVHRSGESLRARYLQSVDLMTALLWPAFAGFAVVSAPFIYHVLGERWLAATIPLMLLCLSSMISLAIAMTWEVFTAAGELGRQARIEFIRALVALTLFIGGCLISIEAAAAARVGDALFAIWLYRPHLNRMTGTRTIDLFPIFAKSALLTAVAIGPATIIMSVNGWDPKVSLIALSGSVIIGVSLWVVTLFAQGHAIIDELQAFLARRLSSEMSRPPSSVS